MARRQKNRTSESVFCMDLSKTGKLFLIFSEYCAKIDHPSNIDYIQQTNGISIDIWIVCGLPTTPKGYKQILCPILMQQSASNAGFHME